MTGRLLTLIYLAGWVSAPVLAAEVDSDRDGLSDFREVHKYFTDPERSDSDSDGIPDGDWNERREYTYTVRTILRVRPPVAKDFINDDYQDARVLHEADRYVELEVIHYPFNTVSGAIKENPSWQRDYAGMAELAPGITTNWNARMQHDLLEALAADGIRVDRLTDRQVVEKVSDWLLERTPSRHYFNAFHVHFPSGEPAVYPGQEESVANDKGDPSWTLQQQLEHEIFGRQMYYHAARGTCTSSAILITTVLRAVGIPTRMIICTPLVDASDPHNLELVRRGLTHHRLRKTILEGLEPLGQANASHTFNEVYVGHHWHRLNYSHLGQNILSRGLYGLLTHIHTFNDLSEANLAPTWGAGDQDDVFKGSNSYTATAVSDLFGGHCGLPNPPATEGLDALTISRARWLGDDQIPDCVYGGQFAPDGSGHVLLHVDEPVFGADASHYKTFYDNAGKNFALTRTGQPDISAHAERGYWIGSGRCREFYMRIPPAEIKKMKRSVAYKLVPPPAGKKARWTVGPDVEITRPVLKDPRTGITTLTITRAYWLHSPDRPSLIAENWRPRNDEGHLLVHVSEFIPDEQAGQYDDFYKNADSHFALVSTGQPTVAAEAKHAWWVDHAHRVREFYMNIPAEALSKMVPGVKYKLKPANASPRYRWLVDPQVIITKPD